MQVRQAAELGAAALAVLPPAAICSNFLGQD